MPTINEALLKLKESKFRAGFHLSEKEMAYVADKGMDVVRAHAQDFIRTRLAPANPPNDGKQTPMRGHPVFVAQHACACCCRGCLEKHNCFSLRDSASYSSLKAASSSKRLSNLS